MHSRTFVTLVAVLAVSHGAYRTYAADGIRSTAAKATVPQTVTVQDIRSGRASVIGVLGVQLGTVVEIVARVSHSRASGGKQVSGYVLEIETIDGEPTREKPILAFAVAAGSAARLAATENELDGLVRDLVTPGKRTEVVDGQVIEAEPISRAEADSFRKAYVGSRHKIIAYEYGTFDGAPANVPKDYGYLLPLSPFGIRTQLRVLGERLD
jgi:hypothetical protein